MTVVLTTLENGIDCVGPGSGLIEMQNSLTHPPVCTNVPLNSHMLALQEPWNEIEVHHNP